jgi:UMP-CMP kinase
LALALAGLVLDGSSCADGDALLLLRCSHTSRKPRHGEQDGVHYYYRERQEMAKEIAAGGFLEHAEVHGNLYGTSRKSLQEVVAQGKMPILDVDVQGLSLQTHACMQTVAVLWHAAGGREVEGADGGAGGRTGGRAGAEALRASGLQGLYVFIAPPSAASLEQRLRGRGTESGAGLEERLAAASRQLAAAEAPGLYDVRVVNDELDAAVESLRQQVVPLLRQRPRVVFILGGPGSGKGTQSQRLVRSFGYRHLSAGDLLRAEQASDSPQAQLIKSYIQDGKIVPVDITCALLLKAMQGVQGEEGQAAERVFLIDGFPRNIDNLEGWQRVVGARAAVSFVLVLDCPREVMAERILERGKTSGRADDNLAALDKRFRVLREQTIPVIDSLAARGLVHRVQGDQSADAVFAEVARVFADQLPPLD